MTKAEHKYTNHLAGETSPYLLQHAHNPVDWYPWGEEALEKARNENKPILVSIGYAACHWCHVMERESFENEATAAIMNEHFVNIKIDREERPDLDHIYMDAVQAMTGSGGWPLNVFLTPETKPFYGGTYFPPRRAFNRASWPEVLMGVALAFKEKRQEIDSQAENLTEHLLQSNWFGIQKQSDSYPILSGENPEEIFRNIMKIADRTWGGFGKAPKFPQTFTIQYLLRYHHAKHLQPSADLQPSAPSKFSSSEEGSLGGETALSQALLSLDRMIEGGIYDQVGGGFARYSTDSEWLAPHFEKMLYDNALLVSVLSEAFQLTKKERYKEVIHETMDFVKRELLHPQGGFYAALDADSEGEEGRFYVWKLEELRQILGRDADVFCAYFDASEEGNWEGKNILRTRVNPEEFAKQHDLSVETLKGIIENGKKRLLAERNKRIRPALDDKTLLSWNALMNTACCKAFMATGKIEYRLLAEQNMAFLLEKFREKETFEFRHTWKNEQAKFPAFLDDYAFLIQALIHLQEITSDTKWLILSRNIMQLVIDQFSEQGTGFFFYTREGQEDIIMRKKEVYDGAVPSGNSVMAYNLYQLSFVFDEKKWRERSLNMIVSLGQAILGYPSSFGIWACLLQEFIAGTSEIAIVGKDHEKLKSGLFEFYLPHRVLMSSTNEDQNFPLLANKITDHKSLIYLCKDSVCQQPVESIARFMSLINRHEKSN